MAISIEHEDGHSLATINGAFVTGRPPEAVPGQTFRTVVALETKVRLPGPGAYNVTASLSSGDSKSVAFYVSLGPNPAVMPPAAV